MASVTPIWVVIAKRRLGGCGLHDGPVREVWRRLSVAACVGWIMDGGSRGFAMSHQHFLCPLMARSHEDPTRRREESAAVGSDNARCFVATLTRPGKTDREGR
jgi:hypothetical protein